MNARNNLQDFLRDLLVPSFDELALFVMSLTFLLVFFNSRDLQASFRTRVHDGFGYMGTYLVAMAFSVGLMFSILHVFTTRRKTRLEKYIMLLFAVAVSAGTGIVGAIHMLNHMQGWLLVFPAWNILSSMWLLLLLRFRLLDDKAIRDDDASLPEVVASSAVAIGVYLLCQRVLGLHWAVTYSICVVYAVSVSGAVRDVLRRQRRHARRVVRQPM